MSLNLCQSKTELPNIKLRFLNYQLLVGLTCSGLCQLGSSSVNWLPSLVCIYSVLSLCLSLWLSLWLCSVSFLISLPTSPFHFVFTLDKYYSVQCVATYLHMFHIHLPKYRLPHKPLNYRSLTLFTSTVYLDLLHCAYSRCLSEKATE